MRWTLQIVVIVALAPIARTQSEHDFAERVARAIAALRFEVKQISSGQNRPALNLTQGRRDTFLVMVREGVPLASVARALGWTDAQAAERVQELVSAGFIDKAGEGYRARIAVITAADVARFMPVDARTVAAVADAIAATVPAVRRSCASIAGLRHTRFEDASLLILSDVLLDSWQIGTVESEVLGKERPERVGGRYYLSVQERVAGTETEAFGVYGNQVADLGGLAIGVYGNRRGVSDLLALSLDDLRARFGRSGPESLNDFRRLVARAIVEASQGSGEVPAELRDGLESLGLARAGRICVPVLGPEDHAALGEIASQLAPELIDTLQEHRPRLEAIYRASPYATEIAFEEYFIWWYHLFYSAVTERLATTGHVVLPASGTTTYVVQRQ